MSRARLERETVIIWNEEEKTATIWSISEPFIKKMQKMGFQGDSRGTLYSRWFIVPKKFISVRGERKPRKKMSEEKRAKLIERINMARLSKQV